MISPTGAPWRPQAAFTPASCPPVARTLQPLKVLPPQRTVTDAQARDKTKLREERDEAQRTLAQSLQRATQYQHELRKKDRAYAKLHEHLNGYAGRPCSLVLVAPLFLGSLFSVS